MTKVFNRGFCEIIIQKLFSFSHFDGDIRCREKAKEAIKDTTMKPVCKLTEATCSRQASQSEKTTIKNFCQM